MNRPPSLKPPFPFEQLPQAYSIDERRRLLDYHHQVAERYHLTAPYFDFCPSNNETVTPLFSADIFLPEMRLRSGQMAVFDVLDMAALIHEQTIIYVTKGAFGRDFPRQPEVLEELLAFMMDGFDAHTLYTVFEYSRDGLYKPISASRITFGRSPRSAMQINGDPQTPLSTFASLYLPPERITDFADGFASTREDEMVCFTRLFRQSQSLLVALGVNNGEYHDVVIDLFPYLGIAYQVYAEQIGRQIKFVVLDTSIERVKNFYIERFGAIAMGKNEGLRPTQTILNTIVRTHYLTFGDQLYFVVIPTPSYQAGIASLGRKAGR